MPPDAKFPTLRLPVTIRFGQPITVDRYPDRADDRLVLRQIIDEVMYEIRELSGQEYVDEYATKKKARPEAAGAAPRSRRRRPSTARRRRPRSPAPSTGAADGPDGRRRPTRRRARSSRPPTPRSSADVLRRRSPLGS